MKLNELQGNSTFDSVKVRILFKFDPRDVNMRDGRTATVWDLKVRDEDTEGKLTLWGEKAGEAYEKGDVVEISKGWCKIYNEQVQVSLGRNGKMTKVDDDGSIPEESEN